MVKYIFIKSPDEWATTKQACRDKRVVRLNLFLYLIYIYIYILQNFKKLGRWNDDKHKNKLGWPNIYMLSSAHHIPESQKSAFSIQSQSLAINVASVRGEVAVMLYV